MKLQDAYHFFNSLKIEATIKSEIKVYEKFKYILSELKIRIISREQKKIL